MRPGRRRCARARRRRGRRTPASGRCRCGRAARRRRRSGGASPPRPAVERSGAPRRRCAAAEVGVAAEAARLGEQAGPCAASGREPLARHPALDGRGRGGHERRRSRQRRERRRRPRRRGEVLPGHERDEVVELLRGQRRAVGGHPAAAPVDRGAGVRRPVESFSRRASGTSQRSRFGPAVPVEPARFEGVAAAAAVRRPDERAAAGVAAARGRDRRRPRRPRTSASRQELRQEREVTRRCCR